MAEFISTLADVSTIWLVCLSFILCLIPLLIVGGMVYGMRKLLHGLPPLFERGQAATARAAVGADRASKGIAKPFVAASALASQVRGTLRGLNRVIRRKA